MMTLHSPATPPNHSLSNRRDWLHRVGGLTLASLLPAGCSRQPAEVAATADPVMRFPEKIPMRVVNSRPPCLETPWRYYRDDLTPNEAFYVRWHLETIPTAVDLRTWRLRVGGHVNKPLELSMEELRRMRATSLVAVNQCSGNSRSHFEPRIPGGQWGNGAMGNARWTGIPLRDLLERAGVKAKAEQVTFNGLDEGPLPSVPDFVKSLEAQHAMEPEVLVAYEMNGRPLPMLNGFPVRLIVPGWFATYWVKALAEITVLPHRFDGFWMQKAYLVPDNLDAHETPQALAKKTVPISRMAIRSFFVRPETEERLTAGRSYPLEGIAFDEGHGIKQVQFSTDGGTTWAEARLEADLGKYSFRRWRAEWTPPSRGTYRLQVRAVNRANHTQPAKPIWNRGGYRQNVIEELPIAVV